MNKQRHRRPSQGGTSPETTPQTGSGVAHFSVSEVVQFLMSVDSVFAQENAGDILSPWDGLGRLTGGPLPQSRWTHERG